VIWHHRHTHIGRVVKSYLFILKLTYKKQKLHTSLLFLLTIVEGLVPPAYIRATGFLVESIESYLLEGTAKTNILVYAILSIIGIFLLQHIVQFGSELTRSYLNMKVSAELQRQVLNKAQAVDLSYFDREDSYNKLHRANQVFGNKIINIYQSMFSICATIVTVAGYIAILLEASVVIFLILLCVLVPSIYLKMRRSRENYEVHYHDLTPVERERDYYERLLTNVPVYKERRVFRLFGLLHDRWLHLQQQSRALILKNTAKEIRTTYYVQILNIITYAITLIILCSFVIMQRIQIASFVMLTQTITRVQSDIEGWVEDWRTLYREGLYVQDLVEFLEEPIRERRKDDQQPMEFPSAIHSIQFHDVSFKYSDRDPWSLANVSFTVQEGETIAIIGENGSGKTTLIKLLAGMYAPTRGKIEVGGIDYAKLNMEDIRKRVSAVFQHHTNIQLTVRESIGLGDSEHVHDMKRIKQVVSEVGLDSVIARLPDQYETYLSRDFGGVQLSGGQWQRLAFARCLMKDAPILVLDEPTSALDPLAELKLLSEFKRMAGGRTTFFVTHRIGSAKIADRILVMDGGRAVEFGTHEELMTIQGRYHALFVQQAKWYA